MRCMARRGPTRTTREYDTRGDGDFADTAEAARSRLETHEHPHRPGSPRMPEITTTPPTFRSAGPLHYNIL